MSETEANQTRQNAARLRSMQRIELVDRLGRELQQRFTFSEIDEFLLVFKIATPQNYSGPNSKWAYSKAALRDVSDTLLGDISRELELGTSSTEAAAKAVPPRNWQSTSELRLFISHISKDKDKATRLKLCLAQFSISGFVAHEDIHPTLEWQSEIERALFYHGCVYFDPH